MWIFIFPYICISCWLWKVFLQIFAGGLRCEYLYFRIFVFLADCEKLFSKYLLEGLGVDGHIWPAARGLNHPGRCPHLSGFSQFSNPRLFRKKNHPFVSFNSEKICTIGQHLIFLIVRRMFWWKFYGLVLCAWMGVETGSSIRVWNDRLDWGSWERMLN